MCLFCKTETKFENFKENHPVTYLPFVCDLFLRLTLTPTLFNEDLLERNRKELLPQVMLPILKAITENCLNISVTLDETVLANAIEEMKNVSEVDERVIAKLSKYFSLETYMTQKDDCEMYFESIKNVFPEFHKSSIDLIPCKVYMNTNNLPEGQNYWGPPYWKIVHFTCIQMDNKTNPSVKHIDAIASLFGIFDMLLPCGMCSAHYRQTETDKDHGDGVAYKSTYPRPFPLTLPAIFMLHAQDRKMFEMSSTVHKACKPFGSYDNGEYLTEYSRFLR